MSDLVLTERETDEGVLVAVADEEVLGETFADGEVTLEVRESFYGSDDAEFGVAIERVVESLAGCATANLVGEKAVTLAMEHGFVERENVLEVEGTLHAQMMWL